MEPVTVVAVPRDHFSTMEKCVDAILQHTRQPFELCILSGGTPKHVQEKWQKKYAGKAQFTFYPEFKNGADLRNEALKRATTRLVAFVDSDVFVRENWLEPMVRCQKDTGAAMVTPIILDRDDRVHTAGNDLFIVKQNGTSYASMELRFHNLKVAGPTNLPRRESDFCEMHCQLVSAEVGKKIDIFDPALREFQEMDAGLTLKRHGYKMMFEPESVVYLFYEDHLMHAEDIPFHRWKWDMRAMYDGFDHFKKKWGLDININDSFAGYLRAVNSRVGFFSQRWPSPFSAGVDRLLGKSFLKKLRWAAP